MLDNEKALLWQVMKDTTATDLKEKIRDDLETDTVLKLNLEDTLRSRDDLGKKLAEANTKQTRLEERIRSIEKSCRPDVDVLTDIAYMEAQKQEIEIKIRIYEMAHDTIEEISARVRNDFAPKINSRTGGMISCMTSGRYDEIKVDPDMGIRLVDKEINKLVNIDDLSVGTIDQVYFSLRFAILGLLKEDAVLPLFLDDCFVNYDSKRLRMILRYLHEEAARSNRQILLFTCHEREMGIMDDEKLAYDLVRL
jgi:DNA repair exonuclease SbcCD ATPase subunit